MDTLNTDASGGQDGRATPPTPSPQSPAPDPQSPRAKRAYTVSDAVRYANSIQTPARVAARERNLAKAWEQQRDPNRPPDRLQRGRVIHGGYSQDLGRTAPLAGEAPDAFDRLMRRILALARPPPHLVPRVRQVIDRTWRTRRVFASHVHGEKLMFYDALYQAAVAGGRSFDRLLELSGKIREGLALSAVSATEDRLERCGRSLQAAWKALWRAAEAGPEAAGDGSEGTEKRKKEEHEKGSRGWRPTPDACGGEELARRYARGEWPTPYLAGVWPLPDLSGAGAACRWARHHPPGPLGPLGPVGPLGPLGPLGDETPLSEEVLRYQRQVVWHNWQVRVGVLGMKNLGDAVRPELEQAIEHLARLTQRRLEKLPGELDTADSIQEDEVGDWEREERDPAAAAAREAEDEEEERERRATAEEERKRGIKPRFPVQRRPKRGSLEGRMEQLISCWKEFGGSTHFDLEQYAQALEVDDAMTAVEDILQRAEA